MVSVHIYVNAIIYHLSYYLTITRMMQKIVMMFRCLWFNQVVTAEPIWFKLRIDIARDVE